MAMNPMQRRATRSFVIGIFLGLMVAVLVAFFFYQKNKQLEADLTAIKAKQSRVMVAADNYESGTVLTEESLVMQEVQTTVPSTEVLSPADFIAVDEETGATLIDEEGHEKQNEIYLKVGVPAGTIITKDMVSIGEKIISKDIRTVEYSMIYLPSHAAAGDYVDIRIQFPEGQDYVVLGKKRIEECTDKTIWIKQSEEEILTLNNAIIDSYLAEGSKLYATLYTEPGLQEPAQQTYPVSDQVKALMETSPNILAEAKKALNERYNEVFSRSREDVIENALGDPEDRAGNVSSGISAEISALQDARKEYITSMGGSLN